jgi:predicted kinase
VSRALLVAGPPASGKSNLGRALARRLRAGLLDQDALTNPLVAVVAGLVEAGDDLDHPRLRELVRDARYDCLLDSAALQLRCGTHAVLVAPFTAETQDPERWRAVERRLRDSGASAVHLVWLQASAQLLERRLRLRAAPRDRPRLDDPRLRQAWLDAIRPPVVPAVTVDASLTRARQEHTVLAALGLA